MSEENQEKKKVTKCIALKKLYTAKDGIVKKGDECSPTTKEKAALKKAKAI